MCRLAVTRLPHVRNVSVTGIVQHFLKGCVTDRSKIAIENQPLAAACNNTGETERSDTTKIHHYLNMINMKKTQSFLFDVTDWYQ